MDTYNAIMDIPNPIMDIHNSIIRVWLPMLAQDIVKSERHEIWYRNCFRAKQRNTTNSNPSLKAV